ncbi:DUF2478 domain-containing protein [Bradyrhizobium sp. Ai1a-2]|uniref:DUF2478 domain-containing protein n=1 Tax=Bradyrhizobium sp. Ai1a-2 TaxID=196490 RepID=UPI0004887A99|nr:DUF2478 domain-containing protein [Bradyrhizobium sp. Ai1a-2]
MITSFADPNDSRQCFTGLKQDVDMLLADLARDLVRQDVRVGGIDQQDSRTQRAGRPCSPSTLRGGTNFDLTATRQRRHVLQLDTKGFADAGVFVSRAITEQIDLLVTILQLGASGRDCPRIC